MIVMRIKIAHAATNRFINMLLSDRVLSGSGASPPFGTTEACRQKMQSSQPFCAGRMNIAKEQHVLESILAPSLITALAFECLRIFERPKEHVP
jgi:hypothetical protein